MKGTTHKNIAKKSHNMFLNDLPSLRMSFIMGINTRMNSINANGKSMYDSVIMDCIVLVIVSYIQ